MDHQGDIFNEFNAVLWIVICDFLLLINKEACIPQQKLE